MSTFSLSSVYAQLTSFANLENFWSLFNTAFGSSYDFAAAASLKSQWQSQDFSLFPQIEIVSSGVLGSAKGAYAISTNRIYLSDAFISSASPQALEAVILEEFGHFVDAQINSVDSAGDEGEYFAKVVLGQSLSKAEITRLKTEDDHAIAVIRGEQVEIEQSTTNNISISQLQLTGFVVFTSNSNGGFTGGYANTYGGDTYSYNSYFLTGLPDSSLSTTFLNSGNITTTPTRIAIDLNQLGTYNFTVLTSNKYLCKINYILSPKIVKNFFEVIS
jgi:hypothetical protein